MTFSLRPSSGSLLPLMAASVRTLVVSWKDAAERKELGCEGGLCDTHEHGHTLSFCELLACCLGLGGNARVLRLELELVNNGAGQEGSSTGIGYLDLLHHLTDDDLDVLIVDVNTLHTVGSLNLAVR